MRYFIRILQDKPIYPLSGSPQVSQHLEKEVSDAVREWLSQFKDKVAELPTVDMGSIDYKAAQSELIKDILAMTGEINAIGRGPRQVSRTEILVDDSIKKVDQK